MPGSRLLRSISLTTVLCGGLLHGGAAIAQNDETQTSLAFPNHIHAGTCGELVPDPVAPLEDITEWLNDDVETNSQQGVLSASRTFRGETDIDMSLEDLLASSHSINVHESQENIENAIACGEIGGVIVDDDRDTLVVAIHPLNDSGYHGIAFLEADGDTTTVRVWLAEPPVPTEPESDATPAT